jgi:hypothetical protein
MFFGLLIIVVCFPLHVYWLVQVARLLRERKKNQPDRLPPLLPLLG